MTLCANQSLCDSWYAYTYGDSTFYPVYAADPDISGRGVVFAFIIAAALGLLLSLLDLIFNAPSHTESSAIDSFVNKGLEFLYDSIGLPEQWKIKPATRAFWVPVIHAGICNLADQMILTGISIMIAGFALHCSISVYHASIVNDLAWFAANAHISALGVLRRKTLRSEAVTSLKTATMHHKSVQIFRNFPKEMFRLTNGIPIALRDRKVKKKGSHDLVTENGKVLPKALKPETYKGPNGASMQPNTTLQQTLVRNFKGQNIRVYVIPQGTHIPKELILVYESKAHYSLQPAEEMTLEGLNRSITSFLSTKCQWLTRKAWSEQYPHATEPCEREQMALTVWQGKVE